VVLSPLTKTNINYQALRKKILFRNKQAFVYKVPYEYKRIQLHIDRQRFDLKIRPGGKTALWRLGFKIEGRVGRSLATIVLSYHVFKCSGTCSCKKHRKLVRGNKRHKLNKTRNTNNSTYYVLVVNWVLT